MQPIVATTVQTRQAAIAKLDAYIARARERTEAGLERIATEVPHDQLVRGAALAFRPNVDGQALVAINSPFDATIHDNALAQFSDKAQIPMSYVRHLQDEARAIEAANAEARKRWIAQVGPNAEASRVFLPRENWAAKLLAQSLTEHAAHKFGADRYLVRGVHQEVRAFLSDKFRRVDCRPGLDALLGVARSVGAVLSDAVVTDTRASVRVIVPKVFEIAPGEFVVFGLSWKNSDYGRGAQDLSVFILRLWCLNGAVMETALRQIHLGARLSENFAYSARTMHLDAAATTSAVRDTARALLSDVKIAETADLLTAAANEKIDAKVKLADLRKRMGKGVADKVGAAYNGPDVEELPPGNTAWRWSNAISWVAKQPETDAEARLDLEREAGMVLQRSAAA